MLIFDGKKNYKEKGFFQEFFLSPKKTHKIKKIFATKKCTPPSYHLADQIESYV
jgi:hypothetical protein